MSLYRIHFHIHMKFHAVIFICRRDRIAVLLHLCLGSHLTVDPNRIRKAFRLLSRRQDPAVEQFYTFCRLIGVAMLVSSKFRGVAIFRTMYFSPQLTSMVVISILWTVLYNSNPNTGLINSLLVSLGLEPINFLTNSKTAMNAIIFMSGWQGAGYQMMIFLAGLQGIPRDQYEAASVDGATRVQQFLYITLPGLKGTIKYVVMITMIQAMKLFTQPYVMTQGGPKNSTKTLVYYIYTQGFQQGNFGYACSVAAVFFVIVVIMSLSMKKLIADTN